MKNALLSLCALLFVCGLEPITFAQGSGASVARSTAIAAVKAKAYVSLDPVPRDKSFEVAVVLSIASGYHMNSNKPLDDFLIPTTITAQFPAGFHPEEMDYPKGQLLKFDFSPDKPLSVYSGTVALRVKLRADANAKIGTDTIPFKLRYQICNDRACLPPVTVPLDAHVNVAAVGAQSHPTHSEIFGSSSKQN